MDTINSIEKSFDDAIVAYRKMYQERLIELFKKAGVYNKTVLFKSDGYGYKLQKPAKGVIEMYPEGYNSIKWSVKFTPFKKNGELSLNSRNLYCGNVSEEEKFIENLLKCIEIIDD